MERVRKSKSKPTLDSVVFSTPEQKLLRFLLSEPTTTFTPRVLSSKLKGVRGLGGAEGITKILRNFAEIGLVEFVDNNRAVVLVNDALPIQLLKTFSAICDLQSVRTLVEPLSTKGILFGSRATGLCQSDSDYDLFVVSEDAEEVKKIVTSHPLGKKIELVVWSSSDYLNIEKKDRDLSGKLDTGMVVWGSAW